MQCTYKVKLSGLSRNNCYRGKTKSITYFCVCVCVCVALDNHYAKRMRRSILSSVVSLAQPYISTLSRKRHDLRGKVLNIKCAFSFSLQFLSEIFLILRKTERDIVINVKTYSCKVPVILVGF